MYTRDDFEEIRPGVFKLKGRDIFACSIHAREVCEACKGNRKVLGTSQSGRSVWRNCTNCFCKGEVPPLTNAARSHQPGARNVWSMARDLDNVVERVNDPTWVAMRYDAAFFQLFGC